MRKILLVGNPNVGKSALFSRLTGANVIISNYPGTTVEFVQGRVKIGGHIAMMIDVPGTYTLESTCRAEDVACRLLDEGDVVINVIDATNLERNLSLTLQLSKKNVPVIVALNMWDETRHRGIYIDSEKLERHLGVPVVPTCSLSGEGMSTLVNRLPEAKTLAIEAFSEHERWGAIGNIVKDVQRLTHRHRTFLETLEELSIKPLTGFPIAIAVTYCAFWIVRTIGEYLAGSVMGPLFEKFWLPWMMHASAFFGKETLLHQVLIGTLVDGTIDFGQSFGLLTTGLFVPVAMVLPYIVSFYLVLGVLEDFGYLPRCAVLADTFMHRLGLHGYAIIPFILGLGCNVPGALAIRILEERREKFIAATLMAVTIPCMAQIAMIVGLVGERGGKYVALVFFTLFTLFIIKGIILNRLLKGVSPEIVMEIPPYRMPQISAVVKKLWMRLSGFVREALPLVFMGVLLVNVLHMFKVIDFIAHISSPVVTGLWGLPRETVPALVTGFLRKDVAVGMLGPLNLTTKELVIGSTTLAVYFPCIATYIVLIRELGIKDSLKSTCIMFIVAVITGALLNAAPVW